MTFLAPITGLIAAALAVPSLLALYFLKLRRRPVRIGSTMLWTQAVHDLQVNAPFKWIKSSWLLWLHLLILALLLMAMARPAVEVAGGATDRVFIVIDQSASMSAADGEDGQTRLEEAKRRAIDSLDRIGGETMGAVVAMAAEPRALTGLTNDRRELRRAIEGIRPTDQPADIRATFELVQALDVRSEDEDVPMVSTALLLFSDGTFPIGDESLTIEGSEVEFERVGSPPSEEVWNNVGIVAIAARRDYEDPATVRIFARLENARAEPVAAPVTLRLDGEVVTRRAVEVPGARLSLRDDGEVDFEPGRLAESFEIETRDAGIVTLSFDRSDLLASDNSVSVVLEPIADPMILLVRPDDAMAGTTASVLMQDVLDELGRVRVIGVGEFDELQAQGEMVGVDLFVVDGAEVERLPPGPTLSFGSPLPMPGVAWENGEGDGDGEGEERRARSTYVLSWSREHPTLRYVSLDAVFVFDHLGARIEDVDGAPTDLARGRHGPLILAGEQGGVRRVAVTFSPGDTNWPLQIGFPIFISSAVDYLTLRVEDDAGLASSTARPAMVRPARDAAQVVVLDGEGREVTSVPTRGEETTLGPTRMSVGVIPRVGVYPLRGADESQPALAVNLANSTETSLRTRAAMTISGRLVEAGAGGPRRPREIWPWFVLVAAVLLACEWMLYAKRMRV